METDRHRQESDGEGMKASQQRLKSMEMGGSRESREIEG
jgi:hypothetical protein